MKLLFTKTNFHIFLLILSIVAIQPCFSSGAPETNATADGTIISARGALARLEAASSGPLYTGNGGENIRLAILAPQVQGEVPAYLPIYIQGLLNNNFSKYSAINLIDRQNLDRIISEQNLAANGRYSDNDFVKIGNLTNAQYFLFGTIQKLSGSTYSLQLSITDSSTGIRRANFMQDGSLTQLERRGTLINEATADILAQLGIQLTEVGKQTLLAGNTSVVRAEAGLARGITAQAGGSEVEALFNFTQAITFDPSQIEALSRLNTLSSTISGGTINQRILNDIQARDRWLEVFKETTRFFNDHPPFEIIFDPNLTQIGETDYSKRTANIGMRIALDSSQAGFGALNALLEGLEKTGRREVWGFSGWPLMDVSPKTAGTVVFGGRRSFSYKVDVALINENNKTISNSSITLNTETINFSDGNIRVTPPTSVGGILNFRNVKTEDLTPTLTIIIVAVNGISSQELNASGYMKIETGDLEKREKELETVEQRRQREREASKRQAQEQKEQEKQLAQVQKEQEKREREATKRQAQIQMAWEKKEREAAEWQAQAQREQVAEQQQRQRLSVDALFDQGTKNYNKGDYDKAIADYTEAIRHYPNYAYLARVYINRGATYDIKGDYDHAIADFTEAIRRNPDDTNLAIAYINRGKVYVKKMDYDRAITDCTQAIRLNSNFADAYYNRGIAYHRKGNYNRAIADYEVALQISPNYSDVKKNLESAKQLRGR